MSEYSEKLKDPRWQKRRLQIMERDGFACRYCGDKKSPLNVHHLGYDRRKAPWDYDDSRLITLCENSHKNVEYVMRALQMEMADQDVAFCLYYLVGLIKLGSVQFAKEVLRGMFLNGVHTGTTAEQSAAREFSAGMKFNPDHRQE